MGALDLSGLTVPIFTAVFGMGWGACYANMVLPLRDRLTKAETRMTKIEEQNAAELAELRRKLMQ